MATCWLLRMSGRASGVKASLPKLCVADAKDFKQEVGS